MSLDEFEDLLLHVVVAVDHFHTVCSELLHGYSLVQFSLRVVPDLLVKSVVHYQRADGTGRSQATIHKDTSALILGRAICASLPCSASGAEIVSLSPNTFKVDGWTALMLGGISCAHAKLALVVHGGIEVLQVLIYSSMIPRSLPPQRRLLMIAIGDLDGDIFLYLGQHIIAGLSRYQIIPMLVNWV
jgi:hypothetical protein